MFFFQKKKTKILKTILKYAHVSWFCDIIDELLTPNSIQLDSSRPYLRYEGSSSLLDRWLGFWKHFGELGNTF